MDSRVRITIFGFMFLSFFAFATCTGVDHRVVRETEGVVLNTAGDADIYGIPVRGIIWEEPKGILQGDPMFQSESGDGGAITETTKAHLWYLYPREKFPESIARKKVKLKYNVIIGESPPVMQIVEFSIVE